MVSVAKFDQWQSTAGVTRNAVLQVVQAVLADPFASSTSNAWIDITGLSATITPTSSTSKILVCASLCIGGASNFYDTNIGLFRNGTQIALPNSYGSRCPTFMPFGDRSQTTYDMTSVANSFLDSPASTSTLTYKLAYYQSGAPGVHYINRCGDDSNNMGDGRGISTITLMEIAA